MRDPIWLSRAPTRRSAIAMNARVAGERWALRRVMNANVSYDRRVERGGRRAAGRARPLSSEREPTVSPSPRAARSSAAVMYSTSISGSSRTPARCARSRSWRASGPAPPSARRRGSAARRELLDRDRLAHAARDRRRGTELLAARRRGPRARDPRPAGSPARPRAAVAHRVGDLGRVLADRAHAAPPGSAARNSSTRPPSSEWWAPPKKPNATVPPVRPRTSRTDSIASCASASVRSAWGRKSRPASVSSTPAAGADEQRHAELGLEPADLLRQARLGQQERRSRPRGTTRARPRRGST